MAGKKLELVKDNGFAPIMLNKASLRLTGINGMRFASFVSMDARENAVEYGYIVSRNSFFEDVDYDYNTNFIMPAGFDTENTQAKLDTIDMPFLCGIAYKPSSNKDIIYTTDGSTFGDDVNYEDGFERGGIYYTCVLTGMTGYNQYHETMVVRPFIKIGENYFYGTTMEKSLYDVALAYQQANGVGANAFVDGIVSATAE
ncbi:MAG: hypothetical protein IJZ20_08655 [Clostridia bacterium]|nr:hypothetical protein [Clostridia bacterium]